MTSCFMFWMGLIRASCSKLVELFLLEWGLWMTRACCFKLHWRRMCSDLGRDSSSFGLSFHGLTADIWFEEESWTNSQNRNVLGHPSNDGPGQPSAQPSPQSAGWSSSSPDIRYQGDKARWLGHFRTVLKGWVQSFHLLLS